MLCDANLTQPIASPYIASPRRSNCYGDPSEDVGGRQMDVMLDDG